MNLMEAISTIDNFKINNDECVRELSNLLNSNVCVTNGAKGCIVIKDDVITRHPAAEVKAVDTCGAGDSFLSAFVCTEDASFSNLWASKAVLETGTTVPNMSDLYE